MGCQTIGVRKLTPIIGAEIHGADLSKVLGNQQHEEIHQALVDNLVTFFRDQTISVDQQKDFGRRFGKLHIHPTGGLLALDEGNLLMRLSHLAIAGIPAAASIGARRQNAGF